MGGMRVGNQSRIDGLEMGQGFGEAGFLQVVAKLGVDVFLICRVPCGEGFGDFAKRIEMARGIAIAPGVVCDDGLAAFEQINELLMHVG